MNCVKEHDCNYQFFLLAVVKLVKHSFILASEKRELERSFNNIEKMQKAFKIMVQYILYSKILCMTTFWFYS